MCGIWTYLLKSGNLSKDALYKSFEMLQSRGPDRSRLITLSDKNIMLGFHRLSIMDTSTKGDQPFIIETDEKVIYTMCNGEIYNFQKLIEKYNFITSSSSDCEIIPLIYSKYGIDQLVKDIRGEYAIIILEINKITNEMICHVTRDPFGVRPLFIGVDDTGICLSSELKGQVGIYKNFDNYKVDQFKGGNYGTFTYTDNKWSDLQMTQYYFFPTEIKYFEINKSIQLIRETFVEAVKCRLVADRPLGFLLSGGVDSSAVVGVSYNLLKDIGIPMYTFSIGFEGGTDEPNAKLVAQYINSDIITVPYGINKITYQDIIKNYKKGLHTHVLITNEEAVDTIEETVRIIESFDLTSNRASVMQLMISNFISKNTDIKVLLCGDASDEQYGSYLYFSKCNDPKEFNNECIRLMDEIYKYDGLRCDRAVSNCKIEIRLPFSDQSLVDLTFSIDPKIRMTTTHGIEKWLFR